MNTYQMTIRFISFDVGGTHFSIQPLVKIGRIEIARSECAHQSNTLNKLLSICCILKI